MKTEYKLIKCYPGFNQLGEIHSSENKNSEWQGIHYYHKYPEHWEKVVETYQILKLSLQRSIKPDIIDVSDSGKEYILSLLKCNGNKIHSVKRKSDNVIFTVGDKINKACYKDIDVIRGFNLLDDLCLASISDKIDKGYAAGKGVNISAIKHVKDVLFTTEDGVDIREGDNYCKVNDHSNYSIVSGFTAEGFHNDYKGLKFSTKEKAEEYILMNKSCLSLSEVISVLNMPLYKNHTSTKFKLELENLVKYKLK